MNVDSGELVCRCVSTDASLDVSGLSLRDEIRSSGEVVGRELLVTLSLTPELTGTDRTPPAVLMGEPSLFSCQGSVVGHSIDHDADTLAEHTFDRKGRHTIGAGSLGSAQRFQGISSKTWRENAHGAAAGGVSVGGIDVDVLATGGVNERLDVDRVGREDRDGIKKAASLNDRDDLAVDSGDLVAEGFFGLEAKLAGTLVQVDAAWDVDLGAGSAEPVDHSVYERVVSGVARMDLARDRTRDVQRSTAGKFQESPVAVEQLVVAGECAHRPAIEQEVPAFPAGHDGADDQLAALARSFSYSAVPSTPSASSSSPSSLKAACWASTSRRSASSTKPCSHTPLGVAPLPLLETSMSSSLGMPQIVAPTGNGLGEDLGTGARGAGQSPKPDHTHQDHGGVEDPPRANASGPRESWIRDRQQRWQRLRGITTSGSLHATAGKQVDRVSQNALLRSSVLSGVDPCLSLNQADPTSSLACAHPTSPPTNPVRSDTLREGKTTTLERVVQGSGFAVQGTGSSLALASPQASDTSHEVVWMVRRDLDGQSVSCSGPHRAFNHTFFNSGADGHAKRPDSAGSSEAASFTVSQHRKNELYSTGTTEEMEMQLISRRHKSGPVAR